MLDDSPNWLGNGEPGLENRRQGAGSWSSLIKETNAADIASITDALHGSESAVIASIA